MKLKKLEQDLKDKSELDVVADDVTPMHKASDQYY